MGDVSYTVSIGGQAASEAVTTAIQQIELEEAVGLAAILRIRFAIAVRDDGAAWTLADDALFSRLAPIRLDVSLGDGEPQTLIDGYVIETQGDFASEPGKSTFDVIGLDPTVLMSLEDKTRAFADQSDSAIATLIFGEYGFDTDVQPTEPTRSSDDVTTVQRGTDLSFVRSLARRNGYETYVDIEGGRPRAHFHAPRLEGRPQGVLTVYTPGATNVNAFKTRYQLTRPARATAKNLDVLTGDEQSAEVHSAQVRALGSTGTLNGDRPRKLVLDRSGLSQSGELSTLAQAAVDESAWALTAEGDLNTVAYGGILRARKLVAVRGVGRALSGLYYVDRVLHVITEQGYKQHFTLRRTATGLAGDEDFRTEDRV